MPQPGKPKLPRAWSWSCCLDPSLPEGRAQAATLISASWGGEFWRQLELGSAVAAELGREPHVVDLRTAPEVLAYEIARTALLLFERERFGWARFQARAAARFFDFQPAHERCVAAAKARLAREADAAREAKRG
jgi:hypothetical protein